jgi:DNA-binding NtrC family response regulator
MNTSVLVVDDDQGMCELLEASLTPAGWDVHWRLRGDEGLALLRERDYDVVLADINLESAADAAGQSSCMTGIDLCRKVSENRPGTPVVVMTGAGTMSSVIAALHAGACDFVTKPLELAEIEQSLRQALGWRQSHESVRRLRTETPRRNGMLNALQGESRGMLAVYDVICRVADKDTTVLLSGESGTGKELVARALHDQRGNPDLPFVAINCAAVPAALLEAELFGHMKGAFTDAKSSRVGLFALAGNGTLLLDEIGEMPLEMQPKLLRVLQERQFRALGGNSLQPMNARIIAASNRDLEREVAARRFREDLYYRLNVVQIDIPPLRSRGTDVLLLARHFVTKYAQRIGKNVSGISSEAARKLLEYDWPGNVRQLENSIERAVAVTQREQITVEDLPERIARADGSRLGFVHADPASTPTLEEVERNHIQQALRAANWNKTRAAKSLGVDRRTLYRKLERYHGS